ncbi:MAG: trigger factor [Deltaproteobacteria bacterium]|nr:trigger factor [Deltaproteobacteria bacterium]MCB9785903.1 trigger factor [Deltaproteobacteria bacterium]
MRTSVETISEIQVKVAVELPAEAVDAEYARQLEAVGRKARVKGFRPGKAPRNLVKRMFAGQLGADTAMKLVRETLDDALATVDRKTVGDPQLEPVVAKEGEPLTYHVHVQVMPEIKLANWEGLSVTVPPIEVDEDAIEAEIAKLRERHKERVPVEDRGADLGDIVIVDTTGEVEGEADDRLTTSGMEVRLGDEHLIPGFGDQLMGARSGEERTVEVSFPEDFRPETLAGKSARLQVSVTSVVRDELPDLDDDFAQDAGHESMQELRDSFAEGARKRAETERQGVLDRRLIEVLLERHPFPVPPAMVERHFQASARDLVQMLMRQGFPQKQAIDLVQRSAGGMVGDSERAVKRHLALEALVQTAQLSIDDAELDAAAREWLDERGGLQHHHHHDHDHADCDHDHEAEELQEAREFVRMEKLHRRALDLLAEHATITEAPDPQPTDADAAQGDDEAETPDDEATE